MRFGIINYWWCDDNGAVLTAYALQQLLKDIGYDSELINMSNMPETRKGGISYKFEKKFLSVSNLITNNCSYKKMNDVYDGFIVGSDQVFRADWVSNRWFLDFVRADKYKIAIAASFGIDNLNISKLRKMQISVLLKRFDAISVREKDGVKLCSELGVKANCILDPVFLVNPMHYDEICDPLKKSKNSLFVYLRDRTVQKEKAADSISKVLNADIFWADNNTDTEDFVREVSESRFVLTDSYHGLCFAIIYNKEYLCFWNNLRGNSRFESVIDVLKLNREKFILEDDNNECIVEKINITENWSNVNKRIIKERKYGVKWIKSVINTKNSYTLISRILRYGYVITMDFLYIILKMFVKFYKGILSVKTRIQGI